MYLYRYGSFPAYCMPTETFALGATVQEYDGKGLRQSARYPRVFTASGSGILHPYEAYRLDPSR